MILHAVEHRAVGFPTVDDDHEQVAVLEGHHVHQSANDLAGAGQLANAVAERQGHALGELHGAAAALHDQVAPAARVEGQKRTLERLGDTDQRDDGRDGHRQARRS